MWRTDGKNGKIVVVINFSDVINNFSSNGCTKIV